MNSMARMGSTTWVMIGCVIPLGIGVCLVASWWRAEPLAAQDARQALAAGRYSAAAQALDRWRAIDPASAEAHLLQGRVAVARGQIAEAVGELQAALTGGWPVAETDLLKALIAAATGRQAEAEAELSRVFDRAGVVDRQVVEALAKIRMGAFDLTGASSVLDRWAHDFPDDPQPHLWRAEIHGRLGDPEAPLRDYRAALQRDPELAEARRKLADGLRDRHHPDEALAEYQAYLKLRPDDALAYLGAARTEGEQGNEVEATRHLDRALALAPANPEVHAALAEAASRREDWPAALTALDRAVALDPYDITIRHRRGVTLARLGRFEEARAEQTRAAQLRLDLTRLNAARARLIATPHDPASQLEIAHWMFDHGHDQEGVKWAEQILRERPDDPEASRLLAEYYRRIGELGLANYHQLQAGPASSARSSLTPAAAPGP